MQPGTIIDLGSPISGSHHGKYLREYNRNEHTHVCEVELISARTNKVLGIVRLVNWGTVHVATRNNDTVVKTPPPPPKKNHPYSKSHQCCCGCGRNTAGGNFLPGHDAKAKSMLRKGESPPQVLIDFIRKTPKWKEKYGHLV